MRIVFSSNVIQLDFCRADDVHACEELHFLPVIKSDIAINDIKLINVNQINQIVINDNRFVNHKNIRF